MLQLFPLNLFRSVIFTTMVAASVTSKGQDTSMPNVTMAESARAELDSIIDRAMTTTKWRKVRVRRKGRRMILVGKTGTTKVKRVFRAKASGTLERMLLEPWSKGPREMEATFVDGQLIYAQWTLMKQEGGFNVPYEKTYINGKLHILRVYEKDGVPTTNTTILPPLSR